MSLYTVEGVSTQGAETVIFSPTIANIAAPKLTEIGSGVVTALNLGYALRGFAPTGEQGSSEDIRLASVQTFENPGRAKLSIDDITYVYDPQAAPATASNKHYEALKEGVKGYLVDRRGIPATTIPAGVRSWTCTGCSSASSAACRSTRPPRAASSRSCRSRTSSASARSTWPSSPENGVRRLPWG